MADSVCYLRLVDGRVTRSELLDWRSARGEMVIVDLDAQDCIIGIELVGDGKPCQEPPGPPGPPERALRLVPK